MPYPGVVYSRVRPTRVWRTLEYDTTKEECTLESKSCPESVAAPTPDRLKWPAVRFTATSSDDNVTPKLNVGTGKTGYIVPVITLPVPDTRVRVG